MERRLLYLTKNAKRVNEYSEKDIEVLEGLDAIRKRPGMYIGGTGIKALHHMFYEILDNAVDEAISGYCNEIKITINKDGSITVDDNGRGIPVGKHPKLKKSTLEIILTTLHSGSKFGGNKYNYSGGLHGVGLSVVNALSEKVTVKIHREGQIWELNLERGKPIDKTTPVGKTNRTGTIVTFKPDDTIFESVNFNSETMIDRIKEIAFLNQGLTIYFTDKREDPHIEEVFNYSGGIAEYVTEINKTKNPLHKDVIFFRNERDNVVVECALQYTDDYKESLYSFVNNIKTIDGGTHELGFKYALSRVVNDIARQKNILKDKDNNMTGDDIREGLTAVLSVKMNNPVFEGQTKGKLSNTEIRSIVDSITFESLYNYFNKNHSILSTIVKKAKEAARAREAERKARQITNKKNTSDIAGLSSKLAQCSSRKPEECELFIVEGNSAGGTAKQGRNRNFQAILPLRGKILNCEKSRITKILSSKEIRTIITAIGAGIGKEFSIDKAKYHKIIIMTDADVDGEHIRTLLLTFFYRFMKPLIDEGYIYIARPPLYKISKGKRVEYVFTEKEKDRLLKELGDNVEVQRYKGLGEMNPEQLWETTMNPENRVLIRITEEDAVISDKVFSTLMGNKVDLRRSFIEKRAKYAEVDFSNF